MKVACSCGKTLQVADALAGKWVRCPHCQQKLRVEEPSLTLESVAADEDLPMALDTKPAAAALRSEPKPTPSPAPAARPAAPRKAGAVTQAFAQAGAESAPRRSPEPKPAAPEPGKIAVGCSCGKTLQIPEALADRRVKCPYCSASVGPATPPPPAEESLAEALSAVAAENGKPGASATGADESLAALAAAVGGTDAPATPAKAQPVKAQPARAQAVKTARPAAAKPAGAGKTAMAVPAGGGNGGSKNKRMTQWILVSAAGVVVLTLLIVIVAIAATTSDEPPPDSTTATMATTPATHTQARPMEYQNTTDIFFPQVPGGTTSKNRNTREPPVEEPEATDGQ